MKHKVIYLNLYAVLFAALSFANLSPVLAQANDGSAENSIDKGDFKVGFSPLTLKRNPKKKLDKEISAALDEMVKPLNELIALPYDVYLNFDVCGVANAFYNPETKEITMCFEFLFEFERVFKKISDKPEIVEDMSAGAMTVFLFHELGHCLIDVWDLPATGREEDAVDQLAMIVLLDGTSEGENMVINAANFFGLVSDEEDKSKLVFWGEHSLNEQRFYDMVCLTYGSNPSKNKYLLGNDFLPKERAVRCPAEFQRVDRAWERLLTPYLKDVK